MATGYSRSASHICKANLLYSFLLQTLVYANGQCGQPGDRVVINGIRLSYGSALRRGHGPKHTST